MTTPRLVAFDLDDTLAPSKSPIDARIGELLLQLAERVDVAIISGGQLAQFQAQVVHQFDVVDVLARDLGDRDVENVEVLAPDQVQQQVERAFERLEDDFERVRRNVQILRHLQDRLPAHDRQRHFLLLRRRCEDGGAIRRFRCGSGLRGHGWEFIMQRASHEAYVEVVLESRESGGAGAGISPDRHRACRPRACHHRHASRCERGQVSEKV